MQSFSLKIHNQLVRYNQPLVMGILNIGPDSFYDGGKYATESAMLKQMEKMLSEGADWIDLGAASSKPGSEGISEAEELNRLLPAIKSILKHFPNTILSIDTYRAKVAHAVLDNGAAIINDIYAGLFDPDMLPCLAKWQSPYLIMHMLGNPLSMQKNPVYKNVVQDIYAFLHERMTACRKEGIGDLIGDPGFGFGKTLDHNFQLLNALEHFQNLGTPILVGLSRKSMIHRLLHLDAKDALNGSSVLNTIALMKGAAVLRVHDVKEAKEAVTLYQKCIATGEI